MYRFPAPKTIEEKACMRLSPFIGFLRWCRKERSVEAHGPDSARAGGPNAKRQPSPRGLGKRRVIERRRRGTLTAFASRGARKRYKLRPRFLETVQPHGSAAPTALNHSTPQPSPSGLG